MAEAIIYSLGGYTPGMPKAILLSPVVANRVMEILIKKNINLFDFIKKYYVCEVGAPALYVAQECFAPDFGILDFVGVHGCLVSTASLKHLV